MERTWETAENEQMGRQREQNRIPTGSMEKQRGITRRGFGGWEAE